MESVKTVTVTRIVPYVKLVTSVVPGLLVQLNATNVESAIERTLMDTASTAITRSVKAAIITQVYVPNVKMATS